MTLPHKLAKSVVSLDKMNEEKVALIWKGQLAAGAMRLIFNVSMKKTV